jgi:hypothetical protein
VCLPMDDGRGPDGCPDTIGSIRLPFSLLPARSASVWRPPRLPSSLRFKTASTEPPQCCATGSAGYGVTVFSVSTWT